MALKKEDEGRIPWFALDARKSIVELKNEIELIAKNCVEDVKGNKLSRLW